MKSQEPMAFPSENVETSYYNWIEQGMTLRDYFAAKTMPSLVKTFENYVTKPDEVAKLAYQYADAMIKAREE
jgi:hypothetical protein